MATPALRLTALKFKARRLYKELHYLGHNYPDPSYPFHTRLHSCFLSHVGGDEEKLEAGIRKAEHIKKEIEALYFLKKYRAMKGRYYGDEPQR